MTTDKPKSLPYVPTPADVERLVQAAVDQGHPRTISDQAGLRKLAVLLAPPLTPAPRSKRAS
ncbi:MAG TPA: hypothetical protein VNQ73_14785 [Ilumatobacter sp.]|nr:hypothetical protein [Ilumatobacter sp.]